MPGPMSTPNGWTEKEHWNHTHDHGATGSIRRSGKTPWDKAHGKWASTRANKVERAHPVFRGQKRAQ